MADINVVPKKRTSAWVWIVVAIVVALIVWAVLAGSNAPTQPVGLADEPSAGPFAERLVIEVVGPAADQAA